ncbi:hypothetical protein BJV78DRAFT_1152493 [Lactifluus subvellereus]|nr:hypothetical protein BJV78DRAFT_1152493 [Lactifluus subvellereus]
MVSSVTPKVEEGGEDDVPVSIRKSFKELRSVKDELERQRGENDRLRAELATSRKEATDVLARFENMKQMTKRSIRKANDFLHDKLTDFTSQYAEAMERIQSAERTHSSQTNALRVALDDLHDANLLIAARTAKLDATQKELSDVLSACALAKENTAQLEKCAEKLALDAEEKALISVALQREILTVLSSLSDERSEQVALRKTLAEQLQTIGELNGRCHSLEREIEDRKQELANHISENATLRTIREASNERENLLSTTIERLNTEKSAADAQLKALRDEIQQISDERRQEHDRVVQLQMRCHALQERFEDQSASLKLARESHGDIQERLITAEGAFAVKLEAETGKLRQEVFAFQERNGFLQRSVEECRRQLENQQEGAMVTRSEYEKRLKDERDGGHSRMQVLQERMLQVDRERTHATKEADDLRDLLTTAQRELVTLREQTQNIQTSLSELGTQVKDLTMQNHALQAENSMLLGRSSTISARYDTNDLNVEEKTFVNRLLEESRSFHEKRIMDKQNELRRRDNQIAEQEARIKSLEKGLARFLKSEDPKFAARSDAQSILNLSKFAASSSPPVPTINETDAEKTNVVNSTCATPQLLQTSSELFKDPTDEGAQSSHAAAPSASSNDRKGGTLISKPARDSSGDDPKDPASDASRAVKLVSIHGQKSSRKPGPQTSELKAQPEQPKPRARKRK